MFFLTNNLKHPFFDDDNKGSIKLRGPFFAEVNEKKGSSNLLISNLVVQSISSYPGYNLRGV